MTLAVEQKQELSDKVQKLHKELEGLPIGTFVRLKLKTEEVARPIGHMALDSTDGYITNEVNGYYLGLARLEKTNESAVMVNLFGVLEPNDRMSLYVPLSSVKNYQILVPKDE